MSNSKKTDKVANPNWHSARGRRQPSSPAKWVVSHGKVLCGPQTLDYGCGRGADADAFKWDRYDPYFAPEKPTRKYNYVVCFFVLNVVPLEEEKKIIKRVLGLLSPTGVAYFAVRRDVGMYQSNPKGYKQRNVILPYPAIRSDKQYCLYEVRKK